ncbi:hypothetical protein CYMTET_18956 [Cymbomonas tetramitiformis]|uniref:Uncharacterized protein n=1 Tax=Cymbomonas tetramitiformis TaxID=36881 RepID=A0AAE0L5U0_9CHLO|nr:hypothetical protein CYMTET_18956 [Cymbomonas tetramitiformis]
MAWWQRSYLGYEGRFKDDCVLELANGKQVQVGQAPCPDKKKKKANKDEQTDKEADPVLSGTTVWDCAVVLAQCVTKPDLISELFQHSKPETCIELGAGTGAVSLACAASGAVDSITITDLGGMMPLIQKNIDANQSSFGSNVIIQCQPLRWADKTDLASLQGPYDLILGSDLIYYNDEERSSVNILIETLSALSGPHTVVLLALSQVHAPSEVERFKHRSAEVAFEEVSDVSYLIPEEYRTDESVLLLLKGPKLKQKKKRKRPVEQPMGRLNLE